MSDQKGKQKQQRPPKQQNPSASSGGGRSRREEGKNVQISKKMSYLLRHGAVKEGLNMGNDGFVLLDEILPKIGATEAEVDEIVRTNDKQRFALTEREGKKYIRANQGHTIQVDGLELKKVESSADVPIAVHGTMRKFWEIIKNEGLSKMSRNHIHLAAGKFGEENVISGMRKTSEILVYINVDKAIKAGIEFFISQNGVILTAGDSKGYLPIQFFEKVERADGTEMPFTPPPSTTPTSTTTTTTTTTTSSPTPAPAASTAGPSTFPVFSNKDFPTLGSKKK